MVNGNYTTLTHNNKDIERLTLQPLITDSESTKESENTGDQWQEFGPYLLLLVLPMLLNYFRRGALLITLPFALIMIPNNNAQAGIWQDLWKTKDQQGQEHFNSEQYQQAAQEFKTPLWQGSAHYKAGDYEQALAAFQKEDSADALFNQGNALVQLQKIDEAIAAYDKALQRDPNLTDAKENKQILEQLKQQQQENQEQQSGDDQQEQDQQNQDKNQQGENQEGKNQDGQSENDQSKPSDQQQGQQSPEEQEQEQSQQEQSSEQENSDEQQNQQQAENDKQEQSEEQQAEKNQPAEDTEEPTDEKSAQAQQVSEQLAKETEQKHQQLLNKVTDDPYMLLRNKMQLEYQKRHQDRRNIGVKKKW